MYNTHAYHIITALDPTITGSAWSVRPILTHAVPNGTRTCARRRGPGLTVIQWLTPTVAWCTTTGAAGNRAATRAVCACPAQTATGRIRAAAPTTDTSASEEVRCVLLTHKTLRVYSSGSYSCILPDKGTKSCFMARRSAGAGVEMRLSEKTPAIYLVHHDIRVYE